MPFPVPKAPTVTLIRAKLPEIVISDELVTSSIDHESIETVETIKPTEEETAPTPKAQNDDTPETAKKQAIRILKSAEAFVGMPISHSGTPGDRLANLIEETKGNAERKRLLRVFTNAMSAAVNERKGNPKAGHTNLFTDTVRYVMACFLNGAGQLSHPAQRRQHWVPLTYLKSFPMTASRKHHNASPKKREAYIESVSYMQDGLLVETIHDENFVHSWKENMKQKDLYFHPAIESAFAYSESLYAHNFPKDGKAGRRDAALAAFMALQAVRMPIANQENGKEKFINGNIKSIMDAVIKNLDSMGSTMFISVQEITGKGPLGFTAQLPRAHRKGDSTTYLMPLSQSKMLFVSNTPLPPMKRKTVLQTSMYGMYRYARRKGIRVYGATPVSIRKAVVEKAFDVN